MSSASAQTLDQRLAALLKLHAHVEEEIERVVHRLNQQYAGGRRSKHEIPPCGTETAYIRHRTRGEQADELCKVAHRIHERQRAAS